MLHLRECAARTDVGPKARRLARALLRGVPVPEGFVVLPDENLDEGKLLASLSSLDAQLFAVRSSALKEDLPGRSAAGLFLSHTAVPKEALADAVRAVRESGQRPEVQHYFGSAVPVAVLIQPMVAAEQLGVLYICRSGQSNLTAICEERTADVPEWSHVSARTLSTASDKDAPLIAGAYQLLTLLGEENTEEMAQDSAPLSAYIEYARLPGGVVSFLQVRPAPPLPKALPFPAEQPPGRAEKDGELVYVRDEEHNPDPLSRAQSGLVQGVADLVPTLRQCVYQGYLYYAYANQPNLAESGPFSAKTAEISAHYVNEIAPACEALLSPLEQTLFAADGALDPRLWADPAQCTLAFSRAFAAYRGVYRIYVAELGPALRRARQHLDELLRANLGESLFEHGALLAAAAEAPTQRLQLLFELGRAKKELRPALLRAYLKRYGAFASCWDVAAPCDDERPEWLEQLALRLSAGVEPRKRWKTAEKHHAAALGKVLGRWPESAHAAFLAALKEARSARQIAEEDDALFFRAQRLLRWALRRRGALLTKAGRLDKDEQIFDLPFSLHTEGSEPFSPTEFARGCDLRRLAAEGERERQAAPEFPPPSRLVGGRPLHLPPRTPTAAAVLHGHGVAVSDELVRGRARVVRTLFPAEASLSIDPDTILVLPALLPSWAAELWRARALITDSGGALSHGAILARERGVPAVVGTRIATRTIADGQELVVDAAQGRVYLNSEEAAACGRLRG